MSEVDRLSNSGLYPILPMGDKRSPGGAAGQPRKGDAHQRQKPDDDAPPPADDVSPDPPRPPKSLIDEYA
jgi:hypothetical protein